MIVQLLVAEMYMYYRIMNVMLALVSDTPCIEDK
jgi:hypothetical protein